MLHRSYYCARTILHRCNCISFQLFCLFVLAVAHHVASAPSLRRTFSAPILGDVDREPSGQLVEAREEVVRGNLELRGFLPPDQETWIAGIVGEVIANLAEVPRYQVLVSSTNFANGGNEQAMVFHFTLLPVKGKTIDAKQNIREAAYLGSPRYFLSLLSSLMRFHRPDSLMWERAQEFDMEMTSVSSERDDVMRNSDYGDSGLAPGILQKPPDDICPQAFEACACARLRGTYGCSWVINQTSGFRICRQDSTPIPCSMCSTQDGCDTSCGHHATPCDCAFSGECGWDQVSNSCKSGFTTACASCGRIYGCNPPKAVLFDPTTGTSLANAQLLRIGFSVNIKFRDVSSGSVTFHCNGATIVPVPRPRLTVAGSYLSVDSSQLIQPMSVNSTDNSRRCTLKIDDQLLSDMHGVPFLGLDEGRYVIKFGDTLPPKLVSSNPTSASTVQSPVEITFNFSETIHLPLDLSSLSAPLQIVLAKLASQSDTGASSGSVEEYSYIDLPSSRIRVHGTKLILNLQGEVQLGRRYTVQLPDGIVTDAARNKFPGLTLQDYTFHTEAAKEKSESSSQEGSDLLPIILLISIGVFVLILFTTGIMVWKCRQFVIWTKSEPPMAWSSSDPKRSTSVHSMHRSASATSLGSVWTSRRGQTTVFSSESPKYATEFSLPGTPVYTPGSDVSANPKIKRSRTEQFVSGEWEAAAKQLRRQKSVVSEKSAIPGRGGTTLRQSVASGRSASKGRKEPTSPQKPNSSKPSEECSADKFVFVDKEHARRSRASTTEAARARSPKKSPNPSPSPPPTADDSRSPKRASPHPSPPPDEPDTHSPKQQPQPTTSPSPPQPPPTTTPIHNFEDSSDDDALQKKWKDIEQQFHANMDEPIAVRKKFVRDLWRKYHPDKNPDNPNAHEVMTKINEASKWFLYEKPGSPSKGRADDESPEAPRSSTTPTTERPKTIPSTEKMEPCSPTSPSGPSTPAKQSSAPSPKETRTRPRPDPLINVDDSMDVALKKQLKEVQQVLFDSKDTPLADRKNVLDRLMSIHNPDKQCSPQEKEFAKVVMQRLNGVRNSFLSE